MKKIIITGSSGFIGKHICQKAASEGYEIIAFGTATSENSGFNTHINYIQEHLPSEKLVEQIKEFQPEFFIHAAGRASVPFSMQNPEADFTSSIPVVFEILESLRKFSPNTQFIFLSSAAVYGNPEKLPVDELATKNPLSPYGFHKHLCEELIREYQNLFKINATIVRIFSCYGNGLERQLLFDACIKAAKGSFIMRGTGKESRDFIHISDVSEAISIVLKNSNSINQILNLASGEEHLVEDIVKQISYQFNNPSYEFDGFVDAGNPNNWKADISKMNALGFTPKTSLNEGIASYAAWFKLNNFI